MAQKKQTIVIKKIIVQGGGHHGGSWKVALADFMTAMMAFFLVMWLLGQNEETKKAVSDYFSTPSVIEYNFQNFGAELTLEKLFLDLVNEPLKAIQSFVEPADKSPNILDMGSAKVIASFMADKMTDIAKNVNISQDGFEFDIPDYALFEKGTANPKMRFIELMNQLSQVTSGLQEAEIVITSAIFKQAVSDQNEDTARKIAMSRLDLISNKIKASFDYTNNVVIGKTSVQDKKGEVDQEKLVGFIRISIHQKENPSKKRKNPEIDKGQNESLNREIKLQKMNVQNLKTLNNTRQPEKDITPQPTHSTDPNLVMPRQPSNVIENPVDSEMNSFEEQTQPQKIESTTISD